MEEASQCGGSAASEDGTCPVLDDVDGNYSVRDCSTVEPNLFSDDVEENFTIGESITEPMVDQSPNSLDPYIGREFESEHATYLFYGEYARHVGFGIRKRFIRRSKLNNEVIGRTYVCSREGLKLNRKEVDHPRPTTRLDCKAMMKVKRYENGKWIIIKFVKEHNHELYPHSACIFQSPLINTYKESPKPSEIEVAKTIAIATKRGRPKKIQSMDKKCRILFENEQRESLSVGDAQTIYDYLLRAQVSNPRFFYAMELDDQQRLRNVFWADTKSRTDYAHFGDVVTFDTSCLTNKYDTKIVFFLGANHHGQSVLLGCALVTDETKASFLWVLRTLLAVMQGGPPKAIITDQHQALKLAVAEAYPETCHRLCLGHVLRRVAEKLGTVSKCDERFMYKFEKCIYDSITVDEFERRWKKLIQVYGLSDQEWLQTLYEERKQWVPVYLKNTFFAEMSICQRGERVKPFLDDYVNQKTCLKDFIDHIELALHRSYGDEEKADLETYRRTINLITGSPYEAQMASLYTMSIFRKFQDEILQIPSCTVVAIPVEQGAAADDLHYLVKELIVKPNKVRGIKDYAVVFNGRETTVSCVCRSFEFRGYLCRHAMVVLFAVGVFDIPSRYILKRWTWDAKKIDICNGSQESGGPEFVAECHNDLRADSMKLAEEGSLTKERYRSAKIFLKEALIKLAAMDKLPLSAPCTKSNGDHQMPWDMSQL